MRTVLLFVGSRVLMTVAAYGHPRHRNVPLLPGILSHVPANGMGHDRFSAAELKTIHKVVSLAVFAIFSVVYLKETLRWNHLADSGLIVLAIAVFQEW